MLSNIYGDMNVIKTPIATR